MDKEIKRLRKKFFILSTSISFVILFVMLLILNLFMQISYHSEFKTADEMIKQTAYSNMPDIDKEIIYLRYFEDKTQTQTAKLLDMSQVQVSRLEKKIIGSMRKHFVCRSHE